jgi:hypothetical protein
VGRAKFGPRPNIPGARFASHVSKNKPTQGVIRSDTKNLWISDRNFPENKKFDSERLEKHPNWAGRNKKQPVLKNRPTNSTVRGT